MRAPTPNLRPEQESAREAPNAPRAQRTILTHAVAGGLTPLVPLPFVDEMILTRVQVRMVQEIAHAHHKNLPADACKALGTESSPRGNALVLLAPNRYRTGRL
ncbi:MAG: hypothetical protein MUF54_20680 [Polyangiaceae bacterium]|jgi:hypothetical protein|nr:hypothetical protein [Polyangiaceae bacterium]